MDTLTNLENYGIFSDEVVGRLNKVAERLGDLSFSDAVSEFNIPESKVVPLEGYKPSEIIDYVPDDYDQTLVIQTEISTGMDSNTVMHLIPIIGALPTTRVIAHGRPAPWWNRNNLLTHSQAVQVGTGDFSPLAIPTLRYLQRERVETATHAGFSLGGDIVPEIPIHASDYDHNVGAIISADGVTGTTRSILKLMSDFSETEKAWARYMAEVRNPAYTEARKTGRNDKKLVVATAFTRLSNLAIVAGLAKGGMEHRLEKALAASPQMKAVLLNCGESELSDPTTMDEMRVRLQNQFGRRVRGRALAGLKHAVNDQIYANAAIILSGLEMTA